jgi:hypothetical protein
MRFESLKNASHWFLPWFSRESCILNFTMPFTMSQLLIFGPNFFIKPLNYFNLRKTFFFIIPESWLWPQAKVARPIMDDMVNSFCFFVHFQILKKVDQDLHSFVPQRPHTCVSSLFCLIHKWMNIFGCMHQHSLSFIADKFIQYSQHKNDYLNIWLCWLCFTWSTFQRLVAKDKFLSWK